LSRVGMFSFSSFLSPRIFCFILSAIFLFLPTHLIIIIGLIPNSVFQFDSFAGFVIGEELLLIIIMLAGTSIAVISIIKWDGRKRKMADSMKQKILGERNEEKENIPTLDKQQNENPLDILKERLAKGEITKKEYGKLKKVLGKT